MSSNDALNDEVEALTSIYDSEVLKLTSSSDAVLALPNVAYSFSLTFPPSYPDVPFAITGTHHVDASAKKGEGEAAANILRAVLARVYAPGQVCLFDLIEEAGPLLVEHHNIENGSHQGFEITESNRSATPEDHELPLIATVPDSTGSNIPEPKWILSEPLVVNKSTFVGRCVRVNSLQNATESISHLLSTNKRVAGATHNITAWRIKSSPSQSDGPEIVVQDCDDDGETAAGGRLLHLMQLMDVWNVVVVVTRWYGGVKLGADRFRCINAVARETLVNGGFVVEDKEKDGKGKGKKGKK